MAEASQPEQPQIYLITPPDPDLVAFPDQLARVLDGVDVACLRLSLATREEDRLMRAADALRDVAHRYDVAMVIDTHVVLAERLGLDGVHLIGSRGVRAARKDLGPDAIVGAFCDASSHDGMTAGRGGRGLHFFRPRQWRKSGRWQHCRTRPVPMVVPNDRTARRGRGRFVRRHRARTVPRD